MDDAACVRERQRVCQLAQDPENLREGGRRACVEAGSERLTLNVRHHKVEPPVDLAGVVHRQDVRMVEPRRDPDLLQKALDTRRSDHIASEYFHRNGPVVGLDFSFDVAPADLGEGHAIERTSGLMPPGTYRFFVQVAVAGGTTQVWVDDWTFAVEAVRP